MGISIRCPLCRDWGTDMTDLKGFLEDLWERSDALEAEHGHKCDAQCWAHMLRYGQAPECNPYEAREAAEREA